VDGGARRDRTADLLRATQALSQLSYSPKLKNYISAMFLMIIIWYI
jgi:hypothetical protein